MRPADLRSRVQVAVEQERPPAVRAHDFVHAFAVEEAVIEDRHHGLILGVMRPLT